MNSRNDEMVRLRMSAACMAVTMMLAACGGGGDSAGTSSDASVVNGTVAGLSVDGLELTNGSDSVTLAANATGFTLPAGGTLAVARQPAGFTKACEVGGSNAAPTVTCGDATGKVTSVAGHGYLDQPYQFSNAVSLAPAANGDFFLTDGYAIYKASSSGGLELVAGDRNATGEVDASGSAARFGRIDDMAMDAQGNMYVADSGNQSIRKVTPAGVVTTFYKGAEYVRKLALDGSGRLYVLDENTPSIKRIDGQGQVVMLLDGQSNPSLGSVFALAARADGTVYYVSPNGLFKVENQQAVTVASDTSITASVSPGRFSVAQALAVDAQGVAYIADRSGTVIRRIDAAGVVTTIASTDANVGSAAADGSGSAAAFSYVAKLALNAAGTVLYAADQTGDDRVRVISNLSASAADVRSVLATNGVDVTTQSGPAGFAYMQQAYGVAVTAQGVTYVSDVGTKVIYKIAADGTMSTFAGSGASASTDGQGTQASFSLPLGLAVDASGYVYVADRCTLRKITPQGLVSTLAGDPLNCGAQDGVRSGAALNNMQDLTVDASGTVYFTQLADRIVRMATSDGTVSTVVSQGSSPFTSPAGIAVDAAGNLFVSDYSRHQVFKIPQGGVPAVMAGTNGSAGAADGAALSTALFNHPNGIAVDSLGNVYVAQEGSSGQAGVRQISADGLQVRTLAGGSSAYGFQNGLGASAVFSSLAGMAITSSGDLLVVDQANGRLRKVVSAKAP